MSYLSTFTPSRRYVFAVARSTQEEAEAFAREARGWGLDAGIIFVAREDNPGADGDEWQIYTKTAGEYSERVHYEIRDEADGGRVVWSGPDSSEAGRRYAALGQLGGTLALYEVRADEEDQPMYAKEGVDGWYQLRYAGALTGLLPQ